MEQHPVPQPITSYEFRLVGDMTLKQFGKLAAGIILALIVYGINPPAFLKWPVVLLFSGIGFAAAFVPFEGRPIDIWIMAFFKRIYSPTQYVWRSHPQVAEPVTKVPPLFTSSSLPTTPPPSLSSSPTVTQPTTVYSTPTPPPSQAFNLAALKTLYERKTPEGKRVEAKFSPKTFIPATPSFPNIIVGYVIDKEGKIIEGAILEIRDTQGNPVRALRSSKLGQFQTATPLPNGEYEIEVEKERFHFDIIKINLEGKIIPPIEIVSKN